MTKKLFIAATGQHVGKTTSTLGLVAKLKNEGYNVGYCKPVGQKHLIIKGEKADKDAVLFASVLDFDIDPRIHSPVVVAPGVTTSFIEDPDQFNFHEDLMRAAAILEKKHDFIVYEGTGHTGVGSIIDFSNAQVAKMLDAEVIIIVEGGIGKTIDILNLNLALYREQGIKISGVIVNKVHEDKIERVKKYLDIKLKQMGIPLLGVIPYDRSLSFPIVSTVILAVRGKVVFNAHQLDNQVEEILAGSLIEIDEFTYFKNILLVVNFSRLKEAVQKIKEEAENRNMEESPLSGVVITGDGRHDTWYKPEDLKIPYLIENEIPLITTRFDTYDTVVKISRIEVKINSHTPWKIKRAIEMIQDHIDLDKVLE